MPPVQFPKKYFLEKSGHTVVSSRILLTNYLNYYIILFHRFLALSRVVATCSPAASAFGTSFLLLRPFSTTAQLVKIKLLTSALGTPHTLTSTLVACTPTFTTNTPLQTCTPPSSVIVTVKYDHNATALLPILRHNRLSTNP